LEASRVSAPFRFPKFFVTNPSPCPYLPGKVERKVFTELTGRHSSELNEALGRIGFRRSQSVAYRPSCIDCSACVSVRVLATEFEASATQRKILRRHADLEVNACKPWTTDEQYQLLRRYLAIRHPGGGMAEMDESDFADMVEQTPVRTYLIEYREPSKNGALGNLVGACLSDQQSDGLSMIYSFFDVGPDARKGLGTFIILDHIVRAARAGLPYVYLGYWVEGSSRMAYKTGFRPLERLGRDGWRRMDEIEDGLPLEQPVALPARRDRRRLLLDA
jgi:arginyl-tRNA--protein-N-Asp/Glu arginylyltransferase